MSAGGAGEDSGEKKGHGGSARDESDDSAGDGEDASELGPDDGGEDAQSQAATCITILNCFLCGVASSTECCFHSRVSVRY